MEPLLHFAIPFAIATVLGLSLRWSFIAGAIAVLPDLDVLLHAHRSVSHSLIIPLSLLLVSIPLWSTSLRFPVQLTAVSWTSHLLLDLVQGYTPILWPVTNTAYMLLFEVQLHMGSTPLISLNLQLLQKPYQYGLFTALDAALFTGEGLIIALVLISIALLWKRGA